MVIKYNKQQWTNERRKKRLKIKQSQSDMFRFFFACFGSFIYLFLFACFRYLKCIECSETHDGVRIVFVTHRQRDLFYLIFFSSSSRSSFRLNDWQYQTKSKRVIWFVVFQYIISVLLLLFVSLLFFCLVGVRSKVLFIETCHRFFIVHSSPICCRRDTYLGCLYVHDVNWMLFSDLMLFLNCSTVTICIAIVSAIVWSHFIFNSKWQVGIIQFTVADNLIASMRECFNECEK